MMSGQGLRFSGFNLEGLMVVSENRAPEYSALNSRNLIIRTPT